MNERLQKLLASAGHGSRRGIEEWIRAGRVTVNGKVAGLGDRAMPADTICLDGKRLDLQGRATGTAVLIYHKPIGEVTTRHDPENRPTVFERLPPTSGGRWIVVGRLDVNTSGLLLFTTDGELAHRLMHPSSEIQREYRVRLRGTPTAAALEQLRRGVELEDGPANFDRIEVEPLDGGGDAWIRVCLHEGRNREVRRLFEHVGFEVSKLIRIRYGNVILPPDLRPGVTKPLTEAEIRALTHLIPGASSDEKTSTPTPAAPRARPVLRRGRPQRGGSQGKR
jgi:23S rRNA pseudouridine2605 synthase